jgi:hypothetical protein
MQDNSVGREMRLIILCETQTHNIKYCWSLFQMEGALYIVCLTLIQCLHGADIRKLYISS